MTGAYTNNDDTWVGKTSFHITQLDYSSLYPSCIINYNIDPQNFLGIVEDPSDNQTPEFSVIEVSDDSKFRHLPKRSFAVFRNH